MEVLPINDLIIKNVDFNGSTLMAVQDKETNNVYAGVSWICKGLGLNKNEKDRQVKNIQSDIVLKRGCLKYQAGVLDPNNETIGLEINYLPLWLAKITITPTMQREQPEITEKLIEYQLKAKDILANVFLHKETPSNVNDKIRVADRLIKIAGSKHTSKKEARLLHAQVVELLTGQPFNVSDKGTPQNIEEQQEISLMFIKALRALINDNVY